MKNAFLGIFTICVLAGCANKTITDTSSPVHFSALDSTQDSSESAPSPIPGNSNPQYPYEARLRREQGTVILKAFVNKQGIVENVKIEMSSGSQLLDDSCKTAFSKWRYRPGTEGWVMKPFVFRINE